MTDQDVEKPKVCLRKVHPTNTLHVAGCLLTMDLKPSSDRFMKDVVLGDLSIWASFTQRVEKFLEFTKDLDVYMC